MASIEEANLLFKNLITYEKSVVMAKKYVKYHKAIVEDLKRLEKLEKALEKIEDILTDKYNHEKYPFPDDVIDAISEVIDNEII